jgi:hypothetical protein
MSHDQRDSLHLQELDKSILCHLFLPCHLPSSDKADFLIQHDHQNEHELLECMKDFLQSFNTTTKLPIFSVLTKCIQQWSNLQNLNNLSVSNLQLTLLHLEPGDFFSLYFHTQNGAILIEMDENPLYAPLISSWQVLLPTKEITTSLKPHFSCFPMPTYRLRNRSQLCTKTHCELLIDLMENSIEHHKSYKSSYAFNEMRDVPQSHYVCQWWIMQFQGITMENNINTFNQFKKKHRDQIRWKDTMVPFRRSGLWMTIKVVLHTILIKRLKGIGTIVYKLLITHFLTYVVYTRYSNISTELLVHCLRKIARRLNKIDGLLSTMVDSNDVNGWIQYTILEIQSKMKQMLPNLDWQQSIKINEDKIQELSIKNLNLDDSKIYRHRFEALKTYLNNNDSHSSNQQYLGVNNHNNSTIANINQIDYVPSIEELIDRSKYSIGISLTRIEIWVESCLEKWINRPLSSNNEKNRFETLLKFFEDYQSYALNYYYSETTASDSIGYSRFILTSITIIYIIHQKLCQDDRFQRLKLHSVNIPNLINLFEYLILPNRDDMIRAYHLYNYFSEFKNRSYPDLLRDIESEKAFGVYFAGLSATMNTSLQEIQVQIELDKQAKIQEVNNAKERYRQLMQEANSVQCECHLYRRRKQRRCPKCKIKIEAENIKVLIYECPIPSKRYSALAVIFELQMPIEIRCYREIIWQFINRPHPQPSHHMYEWLVVPPHKDKLRPYYTGPQNCNVKLVSSIKSITQSHYYTPTSIVSSLPKNFLFENSLNVQISPTKVIPFENECCILTPQISHPDYKHLQSTVTNTEFEQNRVIARLSDCPIRLKPTHSVEFGSFRSGHCLQWWNLLSILEMESLPIDEESVVILIVHSLLQYGPVTTNQNTFINSWCSESHRSVLEDHIVDELISRLNHRLDDCEFNWQHELVLIVITMITMRILTICNATRENKVADLALKCRRVGEKWIDLISESIQIISSLDLIEVGKLRDKKVAIGIACQMTYSVHPDRTHRVLSSNEHIVSLLRAITTVHDNTILNKNQIHTSIFMEHMIRYSERVLVSIQPSVAQLIKRTSYRSLNEFSTIYWAGIKSNDRMDGNWKKRTTDIYDGWYDGQYQSVTLSIDCLRGTFLVDGMTIGFLPENITSNELFLRVFDHHVFEVQPDKSSNTYITKHSYHDTKKVRYTFHFDDRTNHLTIYEQYEQTDDMFQLISHKCFENELPDAFVSNYSHWRNAKDQKIEFRPVQFIDASFLKDKTYVLTMATGYVITTDNTQILVNRSSLLFHNLFKRYFSRLDDEPYVYMMRDDALPSINTIIHIHLSRLGIAFKYNADNNIITSREYSDMCIAEDQWLGTLTGLKSGLLLLPIGARNKKCEYYQCRKLIVPFGNVHAKKEKYTSHQIVTIQRTSFLHQYFVFNLNDRLGIIQSTDSPTGWLYLALLHAITSHPLPDHYTGMTGMERSFQLLKSAGCWNDQPFDEISIDILEKIAAISPKVDYYPPYLTVMQNIHWNNISLPYAMQHFGYYLIVKKLIDTSEQLNFMYPSSDSKQMRPLTERNKNNEILLGKLYWDYRDSYNPTARLSREMEDEIFYSNSMIQYQPTPTRCSYATNYSCIQLENDMYGNGDINLKDTSELSCFPLCKWLTDEFQLKHVWIGLLKMASCLDSKRDSDKIQQLEILVDFLHYISVNIHIQPFYLQMIRTVLKVPTISLQFITFPLFHQYQNIEEVSVRKERITFRWDHTVDQQNQIIAEIENCFEHDSIFENTNREVLFLDTTQINRLLKSWQANKKLRSFLKLAQSFICSVKLEPLNTKIPINPQQFTLELIKDHHRVKLKPTDKSIDPQLISCCREKFFHRSSNELVKSFRPDKTRQRQNEFPHQIFPSVDPRKNPLSDIANHFKNQLHDSWKMLQWVTQYKNEYPSMDEIKQLLDSSRRETAQFWNELVKSIKLPNKLLFETGVLSRIIPTTLISTLLRIWLNENQQQDLLESEFDIFLTKDQRTLLGGTIVNWTLEQQMERALNFARNKKQEDFEKEISNQPHANWEPSKHLPWLILELEMNITIRKIQVDVAYHMMQSNIITNNDKVRNIVMQMNMGEGKTSVIIPMLALSLCSSSSSLVRIVVLKSLFTVNYQSLRFKLGGLLNRRIFPFACRRNMNFNQDQLTQIFNRFQQGLTTSDVILTSPEYILSFDLLTIDRCRRNEFDVSRLMLAMQRWLKTYIRDVFDESDEILHVKYQLIYTVGGQQQIDGGPERWKLIQSVLHLVKKHAADISKNFNKEVCYKPCERKSAFPQFRLLRIQPFLVLCQKIANDWLSEKDYLQDDVKLISLFILDSDSSIDCLNGRFSSNTVQLLLVLRGLLSSEVLFIALKKRHRVNFGVNQNPYFNRLTAVPFRAKDVAAENTEFGHPDVAIVLTQLSYYYSGLNDFQLKQCFDRLTQQESDPEVIYEDWISYDNQDHIHPSIRKWKGVNLNDYQQRTHYLFPILRYNMLVINYFLNNFVFLREAKQFPHKLIASAWDLSSSDRSKIITGFSGTNDTQLLLPVHIRQCDLPELQKTDALVVNNLLQHKNKNYRYLPIDTTSDKILERIVKERPHIQVILDVGALFIDGTNREIAVKWLKLSDKSKIDYAVYFESDSIVACDRQFRHHSFLTSPASERLDHCVIYLDEIHTRGSDFKFPRGFRAALTLGHGLTKDRLVQAAMRMRKLGNGHSLVFWSSTEVHQQIQTLKRDSDRTNRERNVNRHNNQITLLDILRWAYDNTQQSTWDGLHHWAAQSLNFQRKVIAFQDIQWENHAQVFTNKMIRQLARDCLEPEVIELVRMYGASKRLQTAFDIYSARYKYSNISSSMAIHKDILKQLETYGGSKKRLAQLLDEEQERELEQELEEERQLERPPPAIACQPILHDEIKRLCDTNGYMLNLTQLTKVFRPLVYAFTGTTFFSDRQPSSWHQNLWVSTEFQRVIETYGESLDPFLRPPRWVVVYGNQHIIFVSAYEANWLMNRLSFLYYKHHPDCPSITTLRLLLPRIKRSQSILVNTPTLTMPPTITSYNGIAAFNIPLEWLVELFIFNGTLYFENYHEQDAYCKCLGVCPKPRTPIESQAFEKGHIATDGFVWRLEYRRPLQVDACRFNSSPLSLVKRIIENRNNSYAPVTSHVGSIIFNSLKLF